MGTRKNVRSHHLRDRIKDGAEVELSSRGDLTEVHVFDQASIDAIDAALSARRPLLVRGEPGIGKSQLARAAAKRLGRTFVPYMIDSRTEPRDLLWRFDAVSRLARAQVVHATGEDPDVVLRSERFLHPGPLWWAFDWAHAQEQATLALGETPEQIDGGDPERGCVVLIDEIDKAESDVPNGLLNALGAGDFKPFGREHPVRMGATAPLVVITTNEERALPNAFLRRCLILRLALPTLPDQRQQLIDLLVSRGQAHFKRVEPDTGVLTEAAEQLVQDRQDALNRRLEPLPGQAEYLDLVRAVLELGDTAAQQQQFLEKLGRFALRKFEGQGS